MDTTKKLDINKAYELLNYSYSIPEEYKKSLVEAIIKLSTKNLSVEAALKFVDQEQSLANHVGVLNCHQNNFIGFTAEWLVCMEYNGLKNKGNLLMTIVNPDPQSKADLLHIIKTDRGIIVRPGPDVKSGSEDYIINEYERNLKDKYEIPFLDFSGTLTTEDGLKRLSPKKRERVQKMFDEHPNKRPINSSVSNQSARQIVKMMINDYDSDLNNEDQELTKEKVIEAGKNFKKKVSLNSKREWSEFAAESKDVFKSETTASETTVVKKATPKSNNTNNKPIKPKNNPSKGANKWYKGIGQRLEKSAIKAVEYLEEHPRVKEFGAVVLDALKDAAIIGVANFIESYNNKDRKQENTDYYDHDIYYPEHKEELDLISNTDSLAISNNAEKESSERSKPKEHTVRPHPQRYRTKEGIIYIEKEKYTRGGKS